MIRIKEFLLLKTVLLFIVAVPCCAATTNKQVKVLQRFDVLVSPKEIKKKIEAPTVHVLHYNSDQYALSSANMVLLHSLQLSNGQTVVISGHADTQGLERFNIWISFKRADNVRRVLISKFPGINVTMRWYGSRRPVGDNKIPSGKAANRRVMIEIFPQN